MRTNEKLGSKKWSIIKVKYKNEVGISKSKEGAGSSHQLLYIKIKFNSLCKKMLYILHGIIRSDTTIWEIYCILRYGSIQKFKPIFALY